MRPAQDRVFRRRGRATAFWRQPLYRRAAQAACLPPSDAPSSRRLAGARLSRPPLPGRAPSATNWDSNAVLCEHRKFRAQAQGRRLGLATQSRILGSTFGHRNRARPRCARRRASKLRNPSS